jgi:hypothetical protein
MRKRTLLWMVLATMLFQFARVNAQDFDRYFQDKTLRIDYIFSGNRNTQHIAVEELLVSPKWYGKRQRLADVPMEGNGQITMRDHKTHRIIYKNSFSTLFQEWQEEPEALRLDKAFENVFLVPMPKDTADITLDLRNNRRQISASLTHQVVPSDILIRHIGERDVTPYVTLQHAADTTRCIHLAFLSEGYRQGEMDTFIADAKVAIEALFAHEPFKSMRDKFNIIAVEAPSKETGTSEPGKGIWKNTALHSNFDTNYSERYLTTLKLKDMHNLLAGTPYEHILVLVNSPRYGGGGVLNSYVLSTTHNKWYKPVVVHEFGHSFAGLADEYAYEEEIVNMYPHDVEPWEKNITTKVDFKGKWEDLIGKDKNAGFFEGAGYSPKGVYRGYYDCRMRTNQNPEFCPVCQKAIKDVIDFYTK